MDFLSSYDWMTPTNPFSALLFGILFTFIIGILTWLDTKEFKKTVISVITGLVVVSFVTVSLNAVGFFG